MSGPAIHDTGTGPALLLLHAYPLDASQWDAQVAALSDRYRCLRPDFWGCGSSPAPPAEASIDGFARAVLDGLDRRGVERFAVCGSSMGGYVALALVRAAPRRLSALVLAGTRASADDEAARTARAAAVERVREQGVEAVVEPSVERLLCARCRGEPHITDPLRGRARRWTVDGLLAAQRSLGERPDSTSLLPGIDVPTLVVYGTADVLVPVAESRALAAAIPCAEIAEFEAAAHLVNLEQPQAFSRRVGDFLATRLVR